MPPLLEGNFGRLMAILGFVVAVWCIRAPAVGRLIVDLRDWKNSMPLAQYHRPSRHFRRLILLSFLFWVVLCVVFVVSLVLVYQSYSRLSTVARNVSGSDPVILDYWVRQTERANGKAFNAIFALGLLLVGDFFLDVMRDLMRVKLPSYRVASPFLHHPYELSTTPPNAPVFLWQQRVGWAQRQLGEEKEELPIWRDHWQDWVNSVNEYWDLYPAWEPSAENDPRLIENQNSMLEKRKPSG